jgi:hypothetical protein
MIGKLILEKAKNGSFQSQELKMIEMFMSMGNNAKIEITEQSLKIDFNGSVFETVLEVSEKESLMTTYLGNLFGEDVRVITTIFNPNAIVFGSLNPAGYAFSYRIDN